MPPPHRLRSKEAAPRPWADAYLLADIARGEKEVEDRDTILAAAPDKIADWVVILNEWLLANTEPVQGIDPRVVTSPRKKVGRNEPCPCGSGKKYKKCCGLN
jgi:uncharacterized protein